jgi:hypothetical protein
MSEILLEKPNKRTKPDWLKIQIPSGVEYAAVKKLFKLTNYILFAKTAGVQTWQNVGVQERQLS